jgi:hypothetical protein
MIREEITGTGHLISRQDSSQQFQVFYWFEVHNRVVSGAATPHQSRGIVRSEKGIAIPDGEYDLQTDNEVLRVINLGVGGWAILVRLTKPEIA